MDDTTIPKQDRLLKLLKMTASSADGEALTAIRMANALLTEAGWDWDKLISAKITIVGDPFANLSRPAPPRAPATLRAAPPYASPPPPPPPPQPRQPPPSRRNFPIIDSIRPNLYPGHCFCCGFHVDAASGFLFNPSSHNAAAPDKLTLVCAPCNSSKTAFFVPARPAPRSTQKAGAPASAPLGNL